MEVLHVLVDHLQVYEPYLFYFNILLLMIGDNLKYLEYVIHIFIYIYIFIY